MARCSTCGKGGAKARLVDGNKVCQDCWWQAGFTRMDPGYGSGFDLCPLDTAAFKQKLQEEITKKEQSEEKADGFCSVGPFGFIGFSDTERKVFFKRCHTENDSFYLYDFYSYDQLVNFDVVQHSKATISKPGGVGRAVAGGLLFGVVGAIVGASTAKQDFVVNNSQDIVLVINVDDSLQEIVFQAKQEVLIKLRSIFESMSAKSQSQQPTSPEPQPAANNAVSEADAIMKFKELLDMGLITEEEFSAKKAQILGL